MITLLTDFGTSDYFVPAVKGVILTINPKVQIIDITHEIPPQDIETAGFILAACYGNFPKGTVNIAVVDPGVGSARRALIVDAGGYLFVGPDNGIFSYIFTREADVKVYRIANQEFLREPVSATFHGRDVFAPVAAWLSKGISPESIGELLDDYVRLDVPEPVRSSDRGLIEGRIIHIDSFGNCVTNLTERELPVEKADCARLFFCGRQIDRFGSHFEQAQKSDEMFAYPGSAGYWEIALWCASAAEYTGAVKGTEILLEMK